MAKRTDEIWARAVVDLDGASNETSVELKPVEFSAEEWSLLGASRRWRNLEAIDLANMDISDLEPWYELLVRSPPPTLKLLSVGGHCYDSAILGDPSEAVAGLSSLQHLALCGDLAELSPVHLPNLVSLTIRTLGALPDAGWFQDSTLDCEWVEVTAEHGDLDSLWPLLLTPSLREVKLSMLPISSAFFRRLLTSRPPLAALDLETCDMPADTDEENWIYTVMYNKKGWRKTRFVLPGEGNIAISWMFKLMRRDVSWAG